MAIKSFSWRIMLYASVVFIAQCLILSWMNYVMVSKSTQDLLFDKLSDVNAGLLRELNHFRASHELVSDRILANSTVQDLLPLSYKAGASFALQYDRTKVESVLYDPENTVRTLIIGENGVLYQTRNYNSVFSNDDVIGSSAFLKATKSGGENIWFSEAKDLKGKDIPQLYLTRDLRSLTSSFRSLGKLFIIMPLGEIEKLLHMESLGEGEYYAVLDSAGNALFHSAHPEWIGKPLALDEFTEMNAYQRSSDGKLWLSRMKGKPGDWQLLHAIDTSAISISAGKISGTLAMSLLFAIPIAFAILYMVSKSITVPIKTLKETMEIFGNGNLTIRSKVKGVDEVAHLQASFNKMADDINFLMESNERQQIQKRMLELNMLEYQINPHFLYNALDSMHWMAQEGGNTEISLMASALARFFRLGLSKGREFYTLKEEIEHVSQYLIIHQIRFGGSFSFEADLPKELEGALTIKFLLQPVAENAIKHGIGKRGGSGLVRIACQVGADQNLIATVSDNGMGMPPERIAELNRLLSQGAELDEGEDGYGLSSLQRRISLCYGEGYGLEISAGDPGTIVSIKISLETEKSHDFL
jgi:sensor histidine kinase YesM